MMTSKIVRRPLKGFSLVEVMVGLVIGMLGILVIMQTFSVSEARKRTASSGTDAQVSGLSALLAVERDVRMAGFGYTAAPGTGTNPAYGCNVQAYNANATPTSFTFRLVPVLITDGGVGGPDTITVTYGTNSSLNAPIGFSTPSASSATYNVNTSNDRLGFAVGDLVLGTQAGLPCTLGQISGIPGNSSQLNHSPSTGFPYNRPSGLGVNYTGTSALLFNLGTPVINQYFRAGNNLAVSDLKLGVGGGAGNTVTLADNIVNIQAQYGIDTNGDGSIDSWVEPTGIWANDPAVPTPSASDVVKIKAVRIAIVARSSLLERDAVSGTCVNNVGTNNGPCAWQDTAAAPAPLIDLTADPNWRRYRYKVFQTIIPIRNAIWSES